MKYFVIVSSCFQILSTSTLSQSALSLRDAEMAFAKLSAETSTKKAFLKNLDSSGVIFNRGNIVNGVKAWSRAPEATGKLIWVPTISFVSGDDQLGFTSGPFEMRNAALDSVVGSGQYTSVWKRNSEGEWKLMADLGTAFQPSAYPSQSLYQFNEKLKPDNTITDIISIDSAFNAECERNGVAAYSDRVARRFVLNKSEKTPLQKWDSVWAELTSLHPVVFTPVSSGLAKSRDLGYVYGRLQHDGKTGNYLRVWAHTKKGWILLIQVMGM